MPPVADPRGGGVQGQGRTQDFRRGGAERGGGVPRSAKEALIVFVLLKVQSLQLSFRPAGVSLGGGGGGQGPPWPPPCVRPWGGLPPLWFCLSVWFCWYTLLVYTHRTQHTQRTQQTNCVRVEVYTLSASKAIFRARTYVQSYNLFSLVMMITNEWN